MNPETWAIADRAVRELAPRAFDAIGCRDEAGRLRALDPIADSRTAGEAVSATMSLLRRLRPLAFGCRHAVAVGDWALAVAYAAERGREGLVCKRAAELELRVEAVLIRYAIADDVSHAG